MNCIVLAFLITNALFWGDSHTQHCKVLTDFNNLLGTTLNCPDHSIHLIMGVVFFLLAVYFAQKDTPTIQNLFR